MSRTLRSFVSAVLTTLLIVGLIPSRALALDDPKLLEAQAAIVCDQAGNVLWELNPDAEFPMASITKVMTAMVALDMDPDFGMTCTITDADLYWNSQEAGFTPSDTPTLLELFQTMLVYSGNDAAVNIARNLSGSEEAFVDLMNEKAAELGMEHTHFMNTHGLEEEGHYSSVSDLVVMGRYAMEHYPLIASTVRLRTVDAVVDGQLSTFESTDDLMEVYEGLIGIKTGSVESGTAFLGASKRGNVALYTAVLGCATPEGRFTDTATLMDWAYATFFERSFGSEGWVVRVSPYALGFNAHCTSTLGPGHTATVWPEGQISYRRVNMSSDLLAEPGDVISSTIWRQSGRYAGSSNIRIDETLTTAPSMNVFALPLFSTPEPGVES